MEKLLNFEDIIETLNVKNFDKQNKSKHWQKFINNKFEQITFDKLENFRNNGLSDGLDNSRLFSKNDLNNKIDEFKSNIKKLGYKFENILKIFDDKNLGNNNIYLKIDKYFIDYNQLSIALVFIIIEKYVLNKNNIINNVLEIGAGYGNLSKMLLLQNNVKYFLVDLPENLLLQIYYLNKSYPELKIYLNMNKKVDVRDLENFDLFFFTPDQIHHIEDNIKFDLAINSSSFSEMEKDSINEYFNFIQKKINSDGFFFNLNRYFKDSVNQKIRFYEFPYDYYWKKKYSDVFIGFRRLHCLITQRVANKNNEIKDVLNEIKNLSNNH